MARQGGAETAGFPLERFGQIEHQSAKLGHGIRAGGDMSDNGGWSLSS
jgi:hypothetical protein